MDADAASLIEAQISAWAQAEGVPIPEPFAPRAELSSWQKAFVEDWAWFGRRPVRHWRIRPALPFELGLLAEVLETPRIAHSSHVIVSRAGHYLVRWAFRPRLEEEQDIDCDMWTDRDIEATLRASGCGVEPLKRMRREAAGAEGFAGISLEAHVAILDLAASFRDDMSEAARAATTRLRALTFADALDRAAMEASPSAKILLREAVPFEPTFDGGEVPQDASSWTIGFCRPGGVLARCLGRRDDRRD
ncbi:hypothetical protein [Methylocella sp.]|uniref:hypothetical protein n=1 Tax=Methylocella sp. TaxID=1978226 RepID=UPI00378460C1